MDKLRLLYVMPRLPYPPRKGDQAVPYQRLRLLGQIHEITLLAFVEDKKQIAGVEMLQPFCREIHAVLLPRWRSLAGVAWRGLWSQVPLQVLYYHSPEFAALLKRLVEETRFDLVHGFMLRIAPYLMKIPAVKILELIDSMTLNLQRRIALEGVPMRWILNEELRRVASYEKRTTEAFDHCIVVSDADRALLSMDSVSVIPLGVDAQEFAPAVSPQAHSRVIFSGNMGYSPNVHAVDWFVKQCWPEIRRQVPDAHFVIAGGNPGRSVRRLERVAGVEVTGDVPSMAAALRQASLAVAPMLSGSGMQFKILEAMASGLPVVTTSLGRGNIQAEVGREILVADEPMEFTRAVLALLCNPEKRHAIGASARLFISRTHGWELAAKRVDDIYRSILYKSKSSAPARPDALCEAAKA